MNKCTPGPWHWEREEESSFNTNMPSLCGPNGEHICDFGDSEQYYPCEGTPPDEADARLIAAAPDLLRVLQGLIAVIKDGICDPEDIDLYQQAIDIEAKATGEKT